MEPAALMPLLHFDACALLLELRLHRGGFILRDAGLDRAWSAVDEILRFLESEAGQLAHNLDDLDLFRAGFLEADFELGLLFDCSGGCCTCSASGGSCRCGGGNRDVELALESLD